MQSAPLHSFALPLADWEGFLFSSIFAEKQNLEQTDTNMVNQGKMRLMALFLAAACTAYAADEAAEEPPATATVKIGYAGQQVR